MLACGPAMAGPYNTDSKQPNSGKTPALPQCAQPVGTVAIQEPERQWWTQYGLSNPESLLKLMAGRSNCLRVVARGVAMEMRQDERNLGDSGELQRNSNLGKGQVKAADYIIIPDIADANANAGGMNLGGVTRAFGGRYGGLLGGISTKRSEAQVTIALINARTTEQEYIAEGAAKKTDLGLSGGGWGTTGGLGLGGYSDTDIGKVIAAAYFNAFTDLVYHLQGSAPGTAQAAAPIQAYNVTGPLVLRASATPSAKAVRSFNQGDLVYPTGQRNGVWWEVDDENGNRGWVTSTFISPRG
jgi:curli biogenesis system outer membrane secretion channel CsgG